MVNYCLISCKKNLCSSLLHRSLVYFPPRPLSNSRLSLLSRWAHVGYMKLNKQKLLKSLIYKCSSNTRFICFWVKQIKHSISSRLFCCFYFIIAIINRIPRLWNSGGRRLRETWGGPRRNRLCILGWPIRNRLWILGRPIQNRLCILEGLIWKPIRNIM